MDNLGTPDLRGAVDLSALVRPATPPHDDLTKTIDVYDSEIKAIQEVLEKLRRRAESVRNYAAFQGEIIDRFADIGFVVDVRWYETDQADVKMPDINISGRRDPAPFDRSRQAHEVTHDLLGLNEGGVVKVDKATVAALESGSYKGTGKHRH